MQRGFKSRAERISLEIRHKLGIPAHERFCHVQACQHFEIELRKLSDVDCDTSILLGNDNDKFSAMTVHRGMQTAIIHNDSHHDLRQRSNICHELAHCFLGHSGCTVMNDNGTRTYDRRIEDEASYLGGALLLPKDAALYVLKNGLSAQAGRIFGISKPMLNWRLRASGAQTIHHRSVAKYGTR
jgi:Zn-dependent peptidase ImmA (M78 family)